MSAEAEQQNRCKPKQAKQRDDHERTLQTSLHSDSTLLWKPFGGKRRARLEKAHEPFAMFHDSRSTRSPLPRTVFLPRRGLCAWMIATPIQGHVHEEASVFSDPFEIKKRIGSNTDGRTRRRSPGNEEEEAEEEKEGNDKDNARAPVRKGNWKTEIATKRESRKSKKEEEEEAQHHNRRKHKRKYGLETHGLFIT